MEKNDIINTKTENGSDNIKRIDWIDIAKGIGMILVIIGHISKVRILSQYIYCFHMPLFFIISGYLYKNKDKYIKRKVKSILVPYFIFSIISYGYWLIERFFRVQDITPLNAFTNIFLARGSSDRFIYNAVLWFLPCLFITEIIFDFLYKKTNKKYRWIIILAISILGYIYPKITQVRLPFCIDVAMTALMFYYIGFIFKRTEKKITTNNKKINLLSLILGIVLISIYTYIICSKKSGTGMIGLTYGINYPLFYIMALIGSFTVYLVSKLIKSKYLTWIGRNSLYFMCIHEPVKRIIIKIYSKIFGITTKIARENILHIILMALITLIVTSILVIIVNKLLEIIKKRNLLKVQNNNAEN